MASSTGGGIATLVVTSLPRITAEAFAQLFSQSGCVGSRLSTDSGSGNQVGYVDFPDETAALTARNFYNGWKLAGGAPDAPGLALELAAPAFPVANPNATAAHAVSPAAAYEYDARAGQQQPHKRQRVDQPYDPQMVEPPANPHAHAQPYAPQQMPAPGPGPAPGGQQQQPAYAQPAPAHHPQHHPQLQPQHQPAAPVPGGQWLPPPGPGPGPGPGSGPGPGAHQTYSPMPAPPGAYPPLQPPPLQPPPGPLLGGHHGSHHHSSRGPPLDPMPPASLPPGAAPTLYVEGVPPDATVREMAHIFRPFDGFLSTRLLPPKEGQPQKRPLCFVEFRDAFAATAAMETLKGYLMDRDDPESTALRISFSNKRPSGAGGRGAGARGGGGGGRAGGGGGGGRGGGGGGAGRDGRDGGGGGARGARR